MGLVGLGKIARDRHLPAVEAVSGLRLAAVASPHDAHETLPSFSSIEEMLASDTELDAVTLCTPPTGRFEQTFKAIDAGLHVMLEKPPACTVSEAEILRHLAETRGVTLFASWHSRFAGSVALARDWLSDRSIRKVSIVWKEDIRRWHPGQDWILGAGGFGVFDPGINALSIATYILPEPLRVLSAEMTVPSNRRSPILADLALLSGQAPVTATFDFLQTGPQTWDIEVDTDRGTLALRMGGAILSRPGEDPVSHVDREYEGMYAHFADLVVSRKSDVDLVPVQLVADAFLIARTKIGLRFEW